MYALLGNFEGKVEALSPDFVFARASVYNSISVLPRVKVILVKNDNVVPNVYDLPVKVFDGKVIGTWGERSNDEE